MNKLLATLTGAVSTGLAKAVTSRLLKKLFGRVAVVILRYYAASKHNDLLDEVVDTIETIIVKGK